MKRLLIVCLLFAVSVAAQNNKGNISLTFNGEQIDLPISTVTMEKGKDIRISARAENNTENIQQLISLDFTLDKLSLKNGDPAQAENFRLEVRTNKTKEKKNGTKINSGKRFLISFEKEHRALQFSLFDGGEKLTWENLRSVAIRLDITKIVFQNNSIKISGEFSAKLKSGFESFHAQEVAKIENGKFVIII